MPKTKPTHGGKRANAGRKPKAPTEKKPQLPAITLRVHQKTIDKFKRKARAAKLSQPKFFAQIVSEL